MSEQSAYFVPGKVTEEEGQIYRNYHPTQHTESPWGPGFQHGSPPAALVATVLEDGARDAGLSLEEGRFSRMTVEIWARCRSASCVLTRE